MGSVSEGLPADGLVRFLDWSAFDDEFAGFLPADTSHGETGPGSQCFQLFHGSITAAEQDQH